MLAPSADEYAAILATDQLAFTEEVFRQVSPGSEYKPNWHVECITEHLQAVERGEIRSLIINMPPRFLKSICVSIAWPAYLLGRNPTTQIIVGSYGGAIGAKLSRDTMNVMRSPVYQKAFSKTKLAKETEDAFTTTKNGHRYVATVGNGITGFGCDYCFIGSTNVLTQSGNKTIMDITTNDKVWSYNHETRRKELRRVTATFSRLVPYLVQVKTTNGRRIICTPNHPFFVDGREYKEASNLQRGDRLISWILPEKSTKNDVHYGMLSVFKRVYSQKVRLSEIFSGWQRGVLLFKQMFQNPLEHQMQTQVCGVPNAYVLKEQEILRGLQVKGFGAQPTPSVQQRFFSGKALDRVKGWLQVCGMRLVKSKNCTPYGRGQVSQPASKLGDYVQKVSYAPSQKETIDVIESVEDYSREQHTVYDITVEGNHNFFAEGILVHNCIIDDPINPMETLGDNNRIKANEWITGTLFPRANDLNEVKKVVVMQRLHQDDPTGYLLEKDGGWHHLSLPVKFTKKTFIDLGAHKWVCEEGDFLHEERVNQGTLDKMAREGMTPLQIAGQYFQQPTPPGGGDFKPHWLQYYDNRSASFTAQGMNVYILYDPANSKKKRSGHDPDYTAMIVVGLADDNNYYILDIIRDRLNPTERVQFLLTLHKKWNTRAGKPPKVIVEQYGMMTDAFYIARAQKAINYRFPLLEVGGQMAKPERIRRLVTPFEEGRVYLPKYLPYVTSSRETVDLVESFVGELETFPVGRHDDMIDAFARIMDDEAHAVFPKPKVKTNWVASESMGGGGRDEDFRRW